MPLLLFRNELDTGFQMMQIMRGAVFLSCLLLAGTTMAQDAAKEPEQKPAGEEAFPVAKETADGPYVKSTFASWEIRCIKREGGENCSLYQLMKDDTGNPTAEISIVALPEGQEAKAGATFVSPLATLLTRGVTFSIDSDRARRYNFNWCDRGGCVARFGFSAAEIEFMKQGKAGTFTIVALAAPDSPVSLNLPLEGFTDAWTALANP
jgi:invasion protein IalB